MTGRPQSRLPAPAGIRIRPYGDRGVVVRLPNLFGLLLSFKAEFPRARSGSSPWAYVVPGKAALARVAVWATDAEARVKDEQRRRSRAREDAEWDEAAPLHRPATSATPHTGAPA